MNKAITGIISGRTLPTCLSELLQKKSNEDANLREGRRNRNKSKRTPHFPEALNESLFIIFFFFFGSLLLMRLSLWHCFPAPSHAFLCSPCLAAPKCHSGLSDDVPSELPWSPLSLKPFQLVTSLCQLLLSSVLLMPLVFLHLCVVCCCGCFPVPPPLLSWSLPDSLLSSWALPCCVPLNGCF